MLGLTPNHKPNPARKVQRDPVLLWDRIRPGPGTGSCDELELHANPDGGGDQRSEVRGSHLARLPQDPSQTPALDGFLVGRWGLTSLFRGSSFSQTQLSLKDR